MMKCIFTTCSASAIDGHHITYIPSVTVGLCRRHHEDITIINGQQARKYHRELSNKHRWFIWYKWLDGSIRPRRTKLAMEWIATFDGSEESYIRMEENIGIR